MSNIHRETGTSSCGFMSRPKLCCILIPVWKGHSLTPAWRFQWDMICDIIYHILQTILEREKNKRKKIKFPHIWGHDVTGWRQVLLLENAREENLTWNGTFGVYSNISIQSLHIKYLCQPAPVPWKHSQRLLRFAQGKPQQQSVCQGHYFFLSPKATTEDLLFSVSSV